MSRTITSGGIAFMDLTDSRKLEAYIASNLPTVQIYNQNAKTYTPDWSETSLQLSADIFLDSKEVTSDTKTYIVWYKRVGTQAKIQVGAGVNLTINENQLTGSNSIITYICEATYNDTATNPPTAHAEIVFSRTDTGLNGEDAPIVVAQYSSDGATNWTSTLNTAIHKYIRHSYDGGKSWTVAIKMVGEDGTSVAIKGTATAVNHITDTDYYTIVYGGSTLTTSEIGDSYLYGGDLYVCADSRDGQDYFINAGAIQGPKGSDGKSSYVFIRYATDANGSGMSTSPTGKTYMGVYTSETNVAPTTASLYTWSKFVGDNAKRIALSGDSQVFKMSQSGAATPSTIKVTAQAFNTSITSWTYSTNGGQTFLSNVPTGVSRSGNIVTITGSAIESNSIVIKASDGEVEDVFTVYKAVDGTNGSPGNPGAPAPIAFLTNENITFSANDQGQIAGITITSNVVAYNGTTKVTPTIGTISGTPTGMTITTSTIAASNEVMLTITISNNSTLGSASSNMGVISIPVTYPVSTVLALTWSKVNTGVAGTPGNPGTPAYTAMLTNESHVFAGDVSNALESSATTQILAYKGTTAQTVTISSVNGKAASTSDTDTGITGLKFKCSSLIGTSPTITFTCTTSFVSANGTIPIVFTVDGVSFTKMFTYSIAFKGSTGAAGGTGPTGPAGVPATSYWLVSSANVVQKTSTGTISVTPSTLTFTGKSQTGAATPTDYACRWIIAYSTDGTNYTNLYTSTANESSKSITVATTYKAIRARMYLAGGTATLLDEQIIPVISDGTSGANAVSLQIYAPKGYLLKKDLESLTLQTFACEGSAVITSGATYQWSQLINDVWTDINKATEEAYTVTQADVLKSKSYRCVMQYKNQNYIATATVQDATDIYESVMYVSSNITDDDYYWVLYTLVYTEAGEVDPLLGPITISAPYDPVVGDYWYAVNTTNATVTLKKYDGASWVDSTDTQSFSYSWDIINDGSAKIPLSGSAKVKVISRHNFTATATVACEVSSLEEGLLTLTSLSLTDASDPIVSDTEPTVTVNGQIWIKPNENGTYLMFIWDESTASWISGDMDTRSKVYTSRPSSYNDGDLWITATDTDHGSYLQGTLLQAQVSSTTYSAADWSPTLRYDKELAEMQEDLDKLSQYISINNDGLRIRAKNSSGELSPFSSLFTSTELAFYQNSKKLLTLANNQLTAPKIVVEDSLDVEGSISLGALQIVIEDNGSFSFAVER